MIPADSDWFERLFGFPEESRDEVRRQLVVEGTALHSRAKGASYGIGTLETPSLRQLRDRAKGASAGPIRVRNVVGEAGALHGDAAHAGALFQVASQFNLLETTSPDVTPERGVTGYVHDRTQGPACSLAAAAATLYRNYFAPVGDGIGQTRERQIDCLRDLHDLLADGGPPLWEMRNGYALPTRPRLERFGHRFRSLARRDRDRLRAALRIGIHRDVQVTRANPPHLVSQCFCSALPLGYAQAASAEWESFARLILEAAYEATLLAAAENAARSGNRIVFLTLVGGGVFGNRHSWILGAMERAFDRLANTALDVRIVHFRDIAERYRILEKPLS